MKKVKSKIYAIKKSEDHYVFVIEKRKESLDRIREFLYDLGFPTYKTTQIFSLLGDADNNYSTTRYSSKLYEDRYFYLEHKGYKIDIFFGKDQLIASIFTKTDKQEELSRKLFKSFSFSRQKNTRN